MAKRKRLVETEEFWRSMIDQQIDSGQSIRQFCRRHGIAEGTFFAWKKRLRSGDCDAKRENGRGLVPVEVVCDTSTGSQQSVVLTTGTLEIVTPGGCRLRFDESIESDRVRDLLASVLGVERRLASC